MNANLPPKTPTINAWLKNASDVLADNLIPSARLDAEIILAHTLGKPRTWLHAHSDEQLDSRRREIADTRIELRLDHTPIAYITGHKEFYGRLFVVTPSTLIPRPESEVLIELLERYSSQTHQTLIDVGTGSGCLGITAALELPNVTVTLSDISRYALTVATKNAKRLRADVNCIESSLLPPESSYDIVLANLPYVDESWTRNEETDFEPSLALFADDDGLALIKQLIDQASVQVPPDGLLILEADPRQMAKIREYATAHGFRHVETNGYGVVFRR